MEQILEWGAGVIISIISATGYVGIAALMALESANIPIPSEIIMPFSGFLVSQGNFSFFWVVFWGAMGNLIGSLVSYYLGYFGARPFLAARAELQAAERFFQKYGSFAVLISRVLPVVRTFISLPAGIARMNVLKFSLYTFAGSFLWSWALTYVGVVAGENWSFLEPYFRMFDWLIVIVLVIGVIWWMKRHAANPK
ncbi:MAG: DedA family protein [Candidatus Wildermuthbacteria bacterium]|nr:DedA family protein [Candidatus Wildermuthbacteria bacterium]